MLLKDLTISDKTILRVAISAVVALALYSGLTTEELRQEKKLYNKIEDKYVRIRGELGRAETQRLIDQSYRK